jgi:ABC-type transporter Mla subunit MlaD
MGRPRTAIVALVVILLLVVVGWWFLLGPGAGTQSGGDTNIDVNLPSAPVVQPT